MDLLFLLFSLLLSFLFFKIWKFIHSKQDKDCYILNYQCHKPSGGDQIRREIIHRNQNLGSTKYKFLPKVIVSSKSGEQTYASRLVIGEKRPFLQDKISEMVDGIGKLLKRNHNTKSRLVLLILPLIMTLSAAATPIPARTIQSPDGDVIDCIQMREQPAFDHPLLQSHQIHDIPKSEEEFGWQIWHGAGIQCPEGTIPIQRVDENQPGVEATIGYEYATGTLGSRPPRIYGGKATMSVWQPKVENVGEFSLGQIWIISGSYENNDLNSIEAGWQVFLKLYLDNQPRLFVFWTRDAYTETKCYNLRCSPGFIQTSRTVLIEGAISPTSTFGGRQTELTIQIWKDPNPGPWWLGVGLNNGTVLAAVGYWPTELFTHLTDHATNVQWGGEIVNQNIFGRHTATEMGSGYLPESPKAAYMRDLEIAVNIREFQPVTDLSIGVTNLTYYSIQKFSNTSFAYGGPRHSAGEWLRVTKLFYLCFGFLLFF